MRRSLPMAVAAAALCVGQLPAADVSAATTTATTVTAAAAAPAAAAKRVRTPFALTAVAFGSRLTGGDVPAGSDDTALQRITCTNVAGLDRRNYEADVTLPGLGKAEGVTSRVRTVKQGSTITSVSEHRIAKVTLLDTPLGSLEIRGLSSESRAFAKNGRFGTAIENSVATIVLAPIVGAPQVLDLPTPNRPLVIPGLAKIEIGKTTRTVTRTGAAASSNVLDVTLLPTRTRVQVAQTSATIGGGIQRGIFHGFGAGLRADAIDQNVRVGRTPLQPVPCQGTDGRVLKKSVAHLNLADQIVVSGVGSSSRATNTAAKASGTVTGHVAGVELAGGRIAIDAIRGVVNVTRTKSGVARNIKGTTVGSIVIDGKTYSLPKSGPIEIPGLVRIEDAVTTRMASGLKVVALRVTLLDGTGAVVDLGVAQLAVRRGSPHR